MSEETSRRIALVTGGVSGLGAAAAKALAESGARIAVTDLAASDNAMAFCKKQDFSFFSWDVGDFDSCSDGIAAVEKDLGPIDILVNNAGATADAMLHKMTQAQWNAVLRVDLGSMFNMCRPIIGGMRDRIFGRIINISSVNGLRGQIGQTNYSAAKAGVLCFTRALALESASKGVTVNAIAPGYCDTQMVAAVRKDIITRIVAQIPVGRLGQPDDIGRVVAFLASDASGFITGATVSANGGMYMC